MGRIRQKVRHSYSLKHKSRLRGLTNISLLLLVVFLAAGCAQQIESPAQIFTDVNAQEAFDLIQENEGNPDFIIVDVRTPEEFVSGHITNAIMVDFRSDDFRNNKDKLDKDKTYLIYCRTGNRSRGALEIMAELGFKEVFHLTSGIVGWQAEGLPVIK